MTTRSGHKVSRGGQLLCVCAHALEINDRIGAIAAGHRSDIAFLDLGHPNLVPLTDPVNQIVPTAIGGAADTVMVDGRLVLDRGQFAIVNIPDIRRKVTGLFAALTEVNRKTRTLLHGMGTVVEQFCPGRARQPYHLRHFFRE